MPMGAPSGWWIPTRAVNPMSKLDLSDAEVAAAEWEAYRELRGRDDSGSGGAEAEMAAHAEDAAGAAEEALGGSDRTPAAAGANNRANDTTAWTPENLDFVQKMEGEVGTLMIQLSRSSRKVEVAASDAGSPAPFEVPHAEAAAAATSVVAAPKANLMLLAQEVERDISSAVADGTVTEFLEQAREEVQEKPRPRRSSARKPEVRLLEEQLAAASAAGRTHWALCQTAGDRRDNQRLIKERMEANEPVVLQVFKPRRTERRRAERAHCIWEGTTDFGTDWLEDWPCVEIAIVTFATLSEPAATKFLNVNLDTAIYRIMPAFEFDVM